MKFTATDAGPRQISAFNKAWRGLGWAFSSYRSERGHVITICAIGAGPQAPERQAREAIGARFDWTLTRANAKDVIAACEAATKEREANLPPESAAPCGCNGSAPHTKAEHAARYVAPGAAR